MGEILGIKGGSEKVSYKSDTTKVVNQTKRFGLSSKKCERDSDSLII